MITSPSIEVLRGVEGFAEFSHHIGLSEESAAQRKQLLDRSFMPFAVTRYYADLIKSQTGPDREQLLNIILPFAGEPRFVGRFDPYGNRTYRQTEEPFIQHKYSPTMLLHIYDICISNCQFCYKVNEIRHENRNEPGIKGKVDAAIAYLHSHPEVNNVLFSGGDPAAMNVPMLMHCLERLLAVETIRLVRFATKVVAYQPDYFQQENLLEFVSRYREVPGKQIGIIAQINHPAELSETSSRSIRALQQRGVTIRGQPTLARGVNDDVETLVRLHQRFLDLRIIPYYFTVFMPVRGVEQYALLLHHAYDIYAKARSRLNGLEKKGVLLASHDFGKFEICGFLPDRLRPRQIILKWHEAAMAKFLPEALRARIPHDSDDVFVLDYDPDTGYCLDHVFRINGLPYFDCDGIIHGI
jgi:lysine 2,3-aminomutase